MKKNKKIDNKDDWANFTKGYLYLAELAFREILDRKYKDKQEDFTVEFLYIPALFNLKHAIEIFLKHFSIKFLNKEIFDESYYSHDIEELFTKLRKEVSELRLNKAIEKHEKENPTEKGKFSGKTIFDELENIVKKYHSLAPLKDKINLDYAITDLDNTVFKYPINSLTIVLNYEKIVKRFNEVDVKEALIDTINLQKIFWLLHYLISLE